MKCRAPFVLKYAQVQTLPGASPDPVKSSLAFRILDYQAAIADEDRETERRLATAAAAS